MQQGETNILRALLNIQSYADNNLSKIVTPKTKGQPSVNIVGEPLDFFVRDAICNTLSCKKIKEKIDSYNKNFSYYGHQNSPPDIIIRNSDAIEVKKVESITAKEIQLNSSTPKSKLKSDGNTINEECRNCEPGWKEKDIAYAVGHVSKNKLKILTIVYGDCYAADNALYENIRQKVIANIKISGLNISETNELGRINGLDPLQVTNMRVRGMWIIKTPLQLFNDLFEVNKKKELSVFCLMLSSKFESFPKEDKKLIENRMSIKDVNIPDPNNPVKFLNAKLISFNL